MDESRKVEAVKGIISSLFASQRALRALTPEYKWAGLGNLLGDFGEFIATQEYGLAKACAGSNGYDAKPATLNPYEGQSRPSERAFGSSASP